MLRRQRRGPLVDDLAHPGEELLADAGETAADDDHRRVQEVDAGGDDRAEVASGLPDRILDALSSGGVTPTAKAQEAEHGG